MGIDYREVIERETSALVMAVRQGPAATPVPSCPDWTLTELAAHLGGVQRWATKIVETGQPVRDFPTPAEGDDIADFLADGTGALLASLDTADPDAPAWNFTGLQQTKRFWSRRQALEALVHRWDGQAALGAPDPLDAVLAADAIDEFVHLMVPRIVNRTKPDLSTLVGDVHLHCTDTHGEWTFQASNGSVLVTEGHGKAATAVKGPASDLALYLFNRVEASRVEIFGDRNLLSAWQHILRF